MSPARAPALLPAIAFLAALALRPALPCPPRPAPLVALACLALALGRSAPRAIAAAAMGLAWAAAAGSGAAVAGWQRDRPVEVSGRVCSPWSEARAGRSARLCDPELTQGRLVVPLADPVILAVPLSARPAPFGTRLLARGYLDRSPPLANADPAPPGRWRLRVKSALFLATQRSPAFWERGAEALRSAVDRALDRGGRERPGIRLTRALLLGDLAALPGDWRRALRRTGLLHLIAVSGMHVALLAAGVAAAGAWWRRRARGLALALGVLGYLALVGPQPSILRAAGMALVALLGLALGRPQAALQSLATAASAMALFDPRVVDDLGFRLSASATLGLLLLAPRLAPAGERARPLRAALAVSLAAQIATFVWIAPVFHQIPLAAPAWNLLAIPWSALALAVGAAWTAIAVAWPTFGAATGGILDPLAWPLAGLARVPPEPWSNLPLALGPGEAALVALLLAWTVFVAGRRGALLLALACGQPLAPIGGTPGVAVSFLDVGQGDATLLADRTVAILVDGGGQRGRDLASSALLPALARRGRSRLDVAVLTHADFDHCGGLLDLAGSLAIDELWVRSDLERAPCVLELEREVSGGVRVVRPGDRLRRGDFRFEVLPNGAGAAAENDRSLVLSVAALGRRLLLAGDIEARAEDELARLAAASLPADLLKVAHHGSRTSSSELFLALARPRYAIVSAGLGNVYGHPSPSVLRRLADGGARVLRCDLQGEIRFDWRADSPLRLRLPGEPKIP